MREIFLICSVCLFGWGIAIRFCPPPEVAEWAEVDRQAALKVTMPTGEIGVEVSPPAR
jgi:hypothetical protein